MTVLIPLLVLLEKPCFWVPGQNVTLVEQGAGSHWGSGYSSVGS